MTMGLKVLLIVENRPVPIDNRVWAEATALRDQGFRVSIIGPKGATNCQESYLCLEGIHLYRFRLPIYASSSAVYLLEYSLALLMTFWLSLKIWFQQGFDVVHVANPPDIFFPLGLFYRIFGKKFIFDQHDLTPEMFQVKFSGRMKPLYRAMRFFEWASYRASHGVITSNLSQKSFALKRGKCLPERVFVVRNGPDLRRIHRVPSELELRRGWRYVLAYVGEMEVQDGVDYALRALYELVYIHGRKDVGLVLMGDGGQAKALRELSRELRLDDHVYFTGWVSACEISRYLSSADIGLTPDPQNGFNEYCIMVKTMEYMAIGLPVVAFDLAETRHTAQDSALYVSPNNVEEFTSAILALIDDELLRSKLGGTGYRRIEELLNWECERENLIQAYATLFPERLAHISPIAVTRRP